MKRQHSLLMKLREWGGRMANHTEISQCYMQTILNIWSDKQEHTACQIIGNCMAPLLKEGDLLIIKHGNLDIHAGDVIVCEEEGVYHVYRVIKIRRTTGNSYCFLKADRYGIVKEKISINKIIGKVVEVQSANGNLNLNSLFWKYVNLFIAMIFYSNWRSNNRDTFYWRTINNTFLIWRKIKPSRYSASHNIMSTVCQLNRIWFGLCFVKTNKK